MFRCSRRALTQKIVKNNRGARRESYHSFPDPSEKPQISSATSSSKRRVNKETAKGFSVNEKFRLDRSFPLPGSGPGKHSDGQSRPEVQSTKLSNGVTVNSIDTQGLMTAFSFLVQTGSAFEIQHGLNDNTGTTQMLELCAFRSTKTRSHEQMTTEMGQLGGAVQCIASRDGMYYHVDVLRENIGPAMDIVADTILNPVFSDEEIEECKEVIMAQKTELPAEIFSRDAVQMAAYKGSPMGNSHFCPTDKIDNISQEKMQKFRKEFYVGENSFVTAAGIEHDYFVDLVSDRFKNLPRGVASKIEKSIFVGGLVAEERILKEPVIKIAMAFEFGGWRDPALVPACVLQQLLGGGSSFSAGGPGKGMYTRLYREVLNQHHWVESAESFMNVSNDCGIMGIDGSCDPAYTHNLIRVIVVQLTKLAYVPVTDEELNRAKRMLKSLMMMQLESRLVLCEDIARQYAAYGFREDPAAMCKNIDAVTKQDLMGVALKMLQSAPSVGCVGQDISKMPSYKEIFDFTTTTRHEASKKTGKSLFLEN